jgi:hypothetical protein
MFLQMFLLKRLKFALGYSCWIFAVGLSYVLAIGLCISNKLTGLNQMAVLQDITFCLTTGNEGIFVNVTFQTKQFNPFFLIRMFIILQKKSRH